MKAETVCQGCRLRFPHNLHATKRTSYNCSAECWSLFADVLGAEYKSVIVFRQVHQLTVDTYAVQHAGGDHPDKSVAIHLAGLYAAHTQRRQPADIAPWLQQIANRTSRWPHFPPPAFRGSLTVFQIALADSASQHIERVRKWSSMVWQCWSDHHQAIEDWLRSIGHQPA